VQRPLVVLLPPRAPCRSQKRQDAMYKLVERHGSADTKRLSNGMQVVATAPAHCRST
jgi:hypothetical protein